MPTTATAASFDPRLADGQRREIHIVGVDSGTMTISGGRFPDESEEDIFAEGVVGNRVTSTTGWGDGGYGVLEIRGSDGEVSGVEVVFLCAGVEEAAEAELEVEGVTLDPAVREAVIRQSATPEQRAAYSAYLTAHQEAARRIWDEWVPRTHPSEVATAVVAGELTVTGRLAIGDPCYGGPTCVVEVPAGRYTAVVWMDRVDTGRVARLAVYRHTET